MDQALPRRFRKKNQEASRYRINQSLKSFELFFLHVVVENPILKWGTFETIKMEYLQSE